ncbi:alpha-ketoacid dehydrogenase subunit beta [Hydrogenimonas thermophila]|uniref:Pyruvate dehydrogenase E1 component beta subunit n=1 Tax=Hydrogenimonas thermophila TaxID=223786 RepID=A0A1I5QIM2_9BACT|nr:pyruvate dehydrogenase complex E1 component subunit beta [Hydrogenimonas thermophila]SFP45921.1 pyruvate dehydrogenase E1 component beta subunit [Hydrogenimonas thermophila]
MFFAKVVPMLYREALNRAIDETMEIDSNVVLLGEDIGIYGGSYRVTEGLFAKYGEKRVIDTPIAELSIIGNGVGMAIGGLRPVAELMTANFALLAFDQIINHMAKLHYMSAGKITLPMVVRLPQGVSKQLAAQHSESYEQMLSSVPGLIVFAASDVNYAYHALKKAILLDDPVIFIEHELLYNKKGEVDFESDIDPFKALVVKEGSDITVVSYLKMVDDVLEAVPEIEKNLGKSCEVIDLCSLNPIDYQTLAASLKKTSRLVVVEEDHKKGGFGSQITSWAVEEMFYLLDAAPLRIAGEDIPIPYNRKLELASIPTPEKIVKQIVEWGEKSGL